MRNKLFPIFGMSTLLLLSLSSTSYSKVKIEKVFVKIAKKSEIFDQFIYPARVTPKVTAMVLSESQGIVTELKYNLGDKLKKKQVIAKITHIDPVYQYRPFLLRAPVAGVVSKIFTNVGSQVAKGDNIIQLIDPDKTKVTIEVSVRDLPAFKKGMKGVFTSRINDKKINVVINGVSPLVDAATGTATAELDFSSSNKGIFLPGTIGKVSFKTNIHKGYLFPQNVLTYKGNQAQVRIVSKESKVRRIDVKIGAKSRGKIEILSGIKSGDYLIERASGYLKVDSIVSIQNLPKSKELKKDIKKNSKTKTKKRKTEPKNI
jgi:multidrug efflux pump subunit AcrA (membrane-fusion protein)